MRITFEPGRTYEFPHGIEIIDVTCKVCNGSRHALLPRGGYGTYDCFHGYSDVLRCPKCSPCDHCEATGIEP